MPKETVPCGAHLKNIFHHIKFSRLLLQLAPTI